MQGCMQTTWDTARLAHPALHGGQSWASVLNVACKLHGAQLAFALLGCMHPVPLPSAVFLVQVVGMHAAPYMHCLCPLVSTHSYPFVSLVHNFFSVLHPVASEG